MPRKLSFSATLPPGSTEDSNQTTSTKLFKAAFDCCCHPVTGESLLHHPNFNLSLAKALLERCPPELLQDFMLQKNHESGYTPLHSAIVHNNFAGILLLLRHAMQVTTGDQGRYFDGKQQQRLIWHPMTVLAGSVWVHSASSGGTSSSSNNLLESMVQAKDFEGFTPIQLLVQKQSNCLAKCRLALKLATGQEGSQQYRSRFTFNNSDDNNQLEDEDDVLSLAFSALQQGADGVTDAQSMTDGEQHYACEVMTFGRASHHALGVVQQGVSSSSSASNTNPVSTQRVQEFAYERVGKEGSAVAVAAAAHHTLVATQQGRVLSFGLSGKNGRLGLGDSIREAFLPTRVKGPLARLKVMAVAAGENHSLCVTRNGWVFAWGSNRFGQLGIGNNASSSSSAEASNCRWAPRRVEENNMKQVVCVAVAAGEKHSVALSKQGGVYVWGDNTSGQLGVSLGRTGILLKPQQVPALATKSIIQIAAAEQSTLALAKPAPGMATNTVYQWGHGNHVPYKVPFDVSKSNERTEMSKSKHVVNPIEIACAKYHNVAITSGGHVYTWGLHAEPLGRSNASGGEANSKKFARPRSSSFNKSMSSPQLVQGMLPENGGGIAVAVAASEERTAVLTESGTLYTWGATHGKHVLGHEGVRWQPCPKQVPGVHRAVKIALAKEHTVLLVGASFPSLQKDKESSSDPASLELLAARKIAQHVDLFNVVPIFIMAERTECAYLIDYCSDFLRRNFDGVLSYARKREMGCYLDDMISESLYHAGVRFRDDLYHPFIMDLLAAGRVSNRATFERDWIAGHEEWLRGCKDLSEKREVQQLVERSIRIEEARNQRRLHSARNRATSCSDDDITRRRARSTSNASGAGSRFGLVAQSTGEGKVCGRSEWEKKTANLDLSTVQSAERSSEWISKEIRGLKKKLNQISKLEKAELNELSSEQQTKINRRPALELELSHHENKLKQVQALIKALVNEEEAEKASRLQNASKATPKTNEKDPSENNAENSELAQEDASKSFSCEVCGIKCPDKKSYELHQNGRKHRNKVAQVAQEEEKVVAASIVQSFQIQQMKLNSRLTTTVNEPRKGAWNTSTAKPMYKLPPPPHPTVAPVVTPNSPSMKRSSKSQSSPSSFATPPSLRQIVEEQKSSTKKYAGRTPSKPSPGKSPNWGVGPNLSMYLPKNLPPAPTFLVPEKSDRNSYSLADFLTPNKPSPSNPKPTAAPWAASPASPAITASVTKTLQEIQAEETEFVKKKQDSAYGRGGGSWYIERRERADSFTVIQESAEKSREEQLFIEEQLRIEAQIMKDLELQREKSQPSKSSPKKRNQKKGNSNSKNQKKHDNSHNQKKPQAKAKGQNRRGGKKAPTEKGEKPPNNPDYSDSSLAPINQKPTDVGRRPTGNNANRQNTPSKDKMQTEP